MSFPIQIDIAPVSRKSKDILRKWGNKWFIRNEIGSKVLIVSDLDKHKFNMNITPQSARWIQRIEHVCRRN